MNVKKISIITLTYKNWHLLDNAISSVASQIVESQYELEYLIVDDGTNDFDKEHINTLLSQTKLNYRIIVNPENMGTVASFNNAIRQSQGDIIIPLSADDVFFDSSVVMCITKYFESNNFLIITGLRAINSYLSQSIDNALPILNDRKLFSNPKALLKKIILDGNIISGACTYYHRDAFNLLGHFDESYRLLEDYPFYVKALSNSIPIGLLNSICIYYNDNGISNKKNISPMLSADFNKLHHSNLKSKNISFFERRYIKYNRIMSTRERYKYMLFYPEQVLFWIFNKK
ncbi:TPA: glycosyltransferase [Aeromonas veronii]|nr:glycosyltransferase [Aeromonas veronii]